MTISTHHDADTIYAEKNISKVQISANPNDVLDVIDRLPDKAYNDMADI